MEAQESKYPPFLIYQNSTNTITFRPIDPYAAGQTYFFAIVIKEKNSDSVLYSYYCTLKMLGDLIVRDETVWWVDVNYAITWLDDESHGAMVFSEPVNMQYLQRDNNFYKMFNIYWHDINFKDNQEDRKLLDFVVDTWGEDNKLINFTMTFEQPYMLGLLLKKSDKIFIDLKKDFVIDKEAFFFNTNLTAPDVDIPKEDQNVLANSSWHRLFTETSSMRIEM